MKTMIYAVAMLAFAGQAAAQDRIFDSHVHLPDGEASLRDYEAQAKDAHVSVAGIGAMWFSAKNLAPAGQIEKTRANNDALIALAARHPGVMPIVTVHPYDGDVALAELDRVAHQGVKVLKLHPFFQGFAIDDPRTTALAAHAGDLGMVVLMDNFNAIAGDANSLLQLAVHCPKTKFIFAHLGGVGFRFWNILALSRVARGEAFGDNIYFDISGTAILAADSPMEPEFVWTMRNVGIDHLLLGTDFPSLTLARTLSALDRLPLTRGERAKIKYENAKGLFGLK